MDKQTFISYTCGCGSVLNTKVAVKRHNKTIKHRVFTGEYVKPVKVKPEPKIRGRKLSPDSPVNITFILDSKVCDLTEEQLKFRRAYFCKKQNEHRQKKDTIK